MNSTPADQSAGAAPPNRNAQASLMRIASGYRLSQMLGVAAKLGIADLLADGPRSCDELAPLSGTHASSLYRMLRALASAGEFNLQDDGRFGLNAAAELLRSDVPGSVRGYAMMQCEDWIWSAWGQALYSVQTGEPAFNRAFGTDLFTYLDSHSDAAAIFNSGMTGRAAAADVAVAEAYDFSGARTIVDVGGGHGLLLSAILAAAPSARGILLDLPSVASGAREHLTRGGVGERCEIVGGDFFTSVPAGGDVYTLSNVIHDWNDERAAAILRNVRAAMAPGARVLIIETLLPPGNEPHPGKIADLQMLIISGGRERTLDEYHTLLGSSGLAPGRVIATDSPVSVVEAIEEVLVQQSGGRTPEECRGIRG